ncbi:MAG: DUF2378 family protein [Myxococcaceae bacterium]
MGASVAEEALVFGHTVEAFLSRTLRGQLTPKAIARLQAIGFSPTGPWLPAYPRDKWFAVLAVVAQEVFPGRNPSDAYREMGRKIITSYQETIVGKALFAALRVLPTKRILERMARNFRTSNNYTTVEMVNVGPTSAELLFNVVEPEPTFTQGILEAGFPAAGVRGVTVKLLGLQGTSARFAVSWAA